ncbi:MAG TPA: YitT family protein [Clostridiaceae bacterium]|nr:YitT family protein [Clostridiaceae bacterium]
MKSKRHKIYTTISRLIFIIIGAALVSVALEIFLIPNRIIDGGVIGISIMGSYLSGVPVGVFIILLNLPFFFVGYKQIGKTFALSTVFAVVCLSIGVTLLGHFPKLTEDVFLSSIFGGIINGAGVGLIIRNGGSLDGTEAVAIVLDKRSSFSIGEIVMLFNLFILTAAGFVYGWERAMYSLITYFIAYKVIDIVVEGLDESKGVFIISEAYEDISEALIARLGRGLTLLEGHGGYKGLPTNVIYVVVTRLELAKLKNIVTGFDENALITIHSVEASGKRYKKQAIH